MKKCLHYKTFPIQLKKNLTKKVCNKNSNETVHFIFYSVLIKITAASEKKISVK